MNDRIDGWKAIGAHFGRDRSTAMRWAEQRALPVHRVPGGTKASVYAFRSELDAWLATGGEQGAPEQEPPPVAAPAKPRGRWWMALPAAAILSLGVAAAVWLSAPVREPTEELPADPEVAQLYLHGRDAWARRDADSIATAIAELSRVTQRDPGFAPAHAALADAYLLAREFGTMSDANAFARARAATGRALALDKGLHSAHRALAFILYWRDRRPIEAKAEFERALQIAPKDAQTHFWYGNALSDNGAHAEARKHLDQARLLEPGSLAIQTDLAWARWASGDEGAEAALRQVVRDKPDFAVAHECLADILLSRGDYAGFVTEFEALSRSRGSPDLLRRAAALRGALSIGEARLQDVLIEQSLADVADDEVASHARPVWIASVGGQRPVVVDLLRKAAARGEQWGDSGFVGRILQRWAGDEEITALVQKLRQPLMS